jgi:hypothetical protein
MSTPYKSSALVMTEMHTSLTGVFLSRRNKASLLRFMIYEQMSVSSIKRGINARAPAF